MNQLRQPPILMRMNATDSDNPNFLHFYNPHSLYHRQHIRQLLLLHPLIPNPIKMEIRVNDNIIPTLEMWFEFYLSPGTGSGSTLSNTTQY